MATYTINYFHYTGAAWRTGGPDDIPTEVTLTNCTEEQLVEYVIVGLMYGHEDDAPFTSLKEEINLSNGDGCSYIVKITDENNNVIFDCDNEDVVNEYNQADKEQNTVDMAGK